MNRTILGTLAAAAAIWAQSAAIEGNWLGTLQVNGTQLRFAFHITHTPAGELQSTMDSLDQGLKGIPLRSTTFSDGKLHMEIPSAGLHYDGTLSSDGARIDGTFTQGADYPLTLRRVDRVEALPRPQTPKPPFPYDSVDVAYQTPGGIGLAGTLTVPNGAGPFPAALLISGSGAHDRDCTLFEHKPFLVIADWLARRGIAVLRVDNRGVGKSNGNVELASLPEISGDVLAGVTLLKARKEIDPRRIGLIGHSEGALVASLAASRSTDVAFVVLMAGGGVRGEEVMREQSELITRAAGGGDAQVAENHRHQDLMFNALRSSKDTDEAMARFKQSWEQYKAAAPVALRTQLGAGDSGMIAAFRAISTPRMWSFTFLDPAEALRQLRVPVLVMNGSRDLQSSARQNLPPICAALTVNNIDFTIVELPGLNHLFQTCKTCLIEEYGTLEETFSPAALQVLTDWLSRHLKT